MPRVFSDPVTGNYEKSGHPEAPFRVVESAKRLTAAGHKIESPLAAASDADIQLVHTAAHIKSIALGTFSDPDTPPHTGIEAIARVSLAGALSAMEAGTAGDPAFSLMRPPGHHAGKENVSGFCYYNNLAAAVSRALQKSEIRRVAVLDIDVHHGNGTQSLVLGRPEIRFCSLHQFPLYPGSGGESVANCDNETLEEGSGEDAYLKRLEPALERLLAFKPDLLAVSAGFDTYKDDPLAGLKLQAASYRKIGGLLAQTGLRRFAVLEGGYAPELPRLIEEFLDGFF